MSDRHYGRTRTAHRFIHRIVPVILVMTLIASGCITQHTEKEKELLAEKPTIQNYTIHVTPQLQDHTISVEVDVSLHIPENTEKIAFCLNPELSVSEIKDEKGNSLTFIRDYDVILVDIPPLKKPTEKVLTFAYTGQIYRRVLNVTWDWVGEEGCWVRSEYSWYPVIPGIAEFGCHFFTYWLNDYWTGTELSNFWDCWHQGYWTGMTLSVEVPESWTVISSGALTSEEVNDTTKTVTWQESVLIPGVDFVAGQYEVTKGSWNGKEITCYLTENTERAQEYINLTREMLDFFSEKFGEYPFSHLRIVELPGTEGYSQGKPSFVMLDSATLSGNEKDLAQALSRAVASQWWGNSVNGYNMSSVITLDVCLSNYASLLYLRERYGQEEFCEYLYKCQSEVEETFAKYGGIPITYEFAFVHGRRPTRNAVILKTLLMFDALREEVGEQHFYETLKLFISEYKGKSVTVEMLQEEFERSTGKELDQFFEQYYYGIDIPDVTCT